MGSRAGRMACCAVLAVASAACGLPPLLPGPPLTESAGDRVLAIRLPDPAYEALFPHYVELCAVSRFERIGIERGGSAGHAVVYLKGACREPGAPYPTLRVCPERVDDLRDPRHGVGISVNAAFRNVNWVAYPGRALFFSGNLERGQRLDQAHFEATLRGIAADGILRGVEVRPEKLTGVLPGLTPEQQLAESLLGTDVAIRFARSIWCAKLPLTREQVELAVAFLNERNRSYASGEDSYRYSLVSDNCVDLLHHTLAAVGVWEPKRSYALRLRRLFSVSVPANTMVNFATRINLFPLEDFGAVNGDRAMRESLDRLAWLPTRHGALLESAPVHRPNDLYDTSLQMYVVEGPGKRETELARLLLSDARFTDLESNLIWFEERYREIQGRRDRAFWPRSAEYRRERERYLAYVSAQLAEVRGLRAQLEATR